MQAILSKDSKWAQTMKDNEYGLSYTDISCWFIRLNLHTYEIKRFLSLLLPPNPSLLFPYQAFHSGESSAAGPPGSWRSPWWIFRKCRTLGHKGPPRIKNKQTILLPTFPNSRAKALWGLLKAIAPFLEKENNGGPSVSCCALLVFFFFLRWSYSVDSAFCLTRCPDFPCSGDQPQPRP